jgi:hypothetical protein
VRRSRFFALLLVIAAGGCTPGVRGEPATAPAASRTWITREELRTTSQPNAYDAVLAVRSRWVREGALVAVDGIVSGGLERLRQLSVLEIESVEYLEPIAASARFGQPLGFRAVIAVTLARAQTR